MTGEFKVWCKNKNEWEKDLSFLLQDGSIAEFRRFIIYNPDTHICLFYTGIRDNVDEKIYDGDILLDEHDRWFVVEWRVQDAGFWIRKYNDCEMFPLHWNIEMKKIGNKYSDPHLLEVV